MATITKSFGMYRVKVDTKTNKVTIEFIWSRSDKEVFKQDVTPYEAMTALKYYLNRESPVYAEAKDFMMPLIAKEF